MTEVLTVFLSLSKDEFKLIREALASSISGKRLQADQTHDIQIIILRMEEIDKVAEDNARPYNHRERPNLI